MVYLLGSCSAFNVKLLSVNLKVRLVLIALSQC